MSTKHSTRILMDSNQDQLLKINFDVHMYDLACDHLSVGVWDSFGSDRMNITRNIQKQKIDHEGKGKDRPYTDDELVELDYQDLKLTSEQQAEVDADWSSSSDSFKHEDFDSVIESHDFTFLNFYADWCPHCRMFGPTWNDFEKKLNDGSTPLEDADGRKPNFRVLKINCVDFEEQCGKQHINSFPTLRLYRRSTGKSHQFVSYEGPRALEALTAFARQEVKKRHLKTGVTYHNIFKEGCRVKGMVEVARVPGTLHIEARHTQDRTLNFAYTNVSHKVHHLSFGVDDKRAWGVFSSPSSKIPKEYQGHMAPLDGKAFVVDRFHNAPHHYIKVVSTMFESWGKVRSYQMTHQHRTATIGRHDTPQAKFSYDLAPVEVVVSLESKVWYDFLTNILAIVGGAFTVISIASGFFNMASNAFKDNMGKLG